MTRDTPIAPAKLKVLDLFSGYSIREDGVVTSRFGRIAVAAHHGVSRQTVYNRAASARFPDWEVIVRQEVK